MQQMKQNKHKTLKESLLENDLKWLVGEVLYLDMHKTKLGDEKDHIVLAIPVNDQKPAQDLAAFIENGVHKFEDVEVSPATDTKGRYLVYVEVERGPEAYKAIRGILNDTSRLSGVDEWKFVTMKSAEMDFNEENFIGHIITDPAEYERVHASEEEQDDSEATAEPAGEEEAVATESIKKRLGFLLNY